MSGRTCVLQLALIAGIFLRCASLSPAQDPELLRHFDYDRTTPLNIKRIGVAHRQQAEVYDITYDSLQGGVVPAYLVVPKGRGRFAAVIWGHWYWANSSMGNRKEFLEEAVVLGKSVDLASRRIIKKKKKTTKPSRS